MNQVETITSEELSWGQQNNLRCHTIFSFRKTTMSWPPGSLFKFLHLLCWQLEWETQM